MNNFEKEIIDMIPGDTPRQKFEHMEKIREFLRDLSFPKAGSPAESWDIADAGNEAEKLYLLEKD